MDIAYTTNFGTLYKGRIEELLETATFKMYKKKVNLILTSPPFPLNTKKKYGNFQGQDYINWLSGLAPMFSEILAADGSFVIELGNAWEPKRPVMSTLSLRTLLSILENGKFVLCQQFVWYNPARLPTPVQWVNIKRTRVKDSFTNIWWMSKTDNPKASNRNVLVKYSDHMKNLLEKQQYNAGKRPSEHNIGRTSFLTNNTGAIPSNVLIFPNTKSKTKYQEHCKENDLYPHPARMPTEIPDFFIRFLTEPGDIVLDPFAGSNTTGAVAEKLGRQWISVEPDYDYIKGSLGRFDPSNIVNSSIR